MKSQLVVTSGSHGLAVAHTARAAVTLVPTAAVPSPETPYRFLIHPRIAPLPANVNRMYADLTRQLGGGRLGTRCVAFPRVRRGLSRMPP